jgi:hypothetical protein
MAIDAAALVAFQENAFRTRARLHATMERIEASRRPPDTELPRGGSGSDQGLSSTSEMSLSRPWRDSADPTID